MTKIFIVTRLWNNTWRIESVNFCQKRQFFLIGINVATWRRKRQWVVLSTLRFYTNQHVMIKIWVVGSEFDIFFNEPGIHNVFYWLERVWYRRGRYASWFFVSCLLCCKTQYFGLYGRNFRTKKASKWWSNYRQSTIVLVIIYRSEERPPSKSLTRSCFYLLHSYSRFSLKADKML